MPRKPVTNFGKVDVNGLYTAADTSILLTTGHGARLPSSFPFPLVWWNATDFADPADDPLVEIVNCTVRATDTLTVTRGAEATSASTKNTAGKSYRMVLSWTKAMHDDLLTGEPGTVGLFFQAAAPIGWTQVTTQNNKALRVVNTAGGGAAGATAFTTVFGAGRTTAAHTLATADIPAHTHNIVTGVSGLVGEIIRSQDTQSSSRASGSTGGGGAHSHNLTMDLQYIDVILCSKD